MSTKERVFNLDVQDLKARMEREEFNLNPDTGSLERSVFIGTVFGLMPSGKFYTSWASSNVEKCDVCDGLGTVHNPNANFEEWHRLCEERSQLTKEALDTHGAWCNGNWPVEISERAELLDKQIAAVVENLSCQNCGGMGSREAWLDSLWTEQAEEALGKVGLFLFNGDGDPCDLFVGESKDADEDGGDDDEDETGGDGPPVSLPNTARHYRDESTWMSPEERAQAFWALWS